MEYLLQSASKPILVDVWAEWCQPCRRLTPLLERLSEKHPEIDFYKVDADANPSVLEEYDIRSIPTVLLYTDEGKHVGTMVGAAAGEAAVELWIKDTLGLD
jgi:thioredoxin 1